MIKTFQSKRAFLQFHRLKKRKRMWAAMTIKIFTNLYSKSLKHSKHFHLYPANRSKEKTVFFTKTGDNGLSKIHSGVLFKDHLIFEAIGAAEELNSYIGLAREYVKDDDKLMPLAEKLRRIQLVIVDVTDIVCSVRLTSDKTIDKTKPPEPVTTAKVTRRDIADLEELIAHYGSLLPPVEKGVIPGGGKASAALHVAKTICRRCERILVTIFKDMNTEKDLLAYINRLSTYLSQAARISAKFANRTETIYKPLKKGERVISDK